MITPYNLLRHELVGLKAKATAGGRTIAGEVAGETEKTITIKTPEGAKKVVKEASMLEFLLPGDAVVKVDGKLLAGRPQDRIKKKHRIRF